MTASDTVEADIYQQIRSSILEHRLVPGTKLTEDALCSVFSVGRTAVRRVLLLLAQDQIVELQKNKGATVARPSRKESEDVFEARGVIEDVLIRSAAQSASTEDVARLRAHVRREEAALSQGDIAQWIRLSGEFHIELARIARNEALRGFLEQLVFRTSLIIALYGQQSGTNCCTAEHTEIADAIEKGDAKRAAALMRKHLEAIQTKLDFDRGERACNLSSIFSGQSGSVPSA